MSDDLVLDPDPFLFMDEFGNVFDHCVYVDDDGNETPITFENRPTRPR